MKPFFYFLFFYLLLLTSSCDKEPPGETMDGRGTFYCKVNGEDYLPDCHGFACQDLTAGYSTVGDAIAISALRDNEDKLTYIYLYIYNVSSLPSLIRENDPDQYLDNTEILKECGSIFLDTKQDFDLNLTKVDLENGIISGTFSGTFYRKDTDYNCSVDTIQLTNGLFDLPITF